MKLLRSLWVLAWIVLASSLFAQAPNLDFTLRYNSQLSRYEVYVRPTATQAIFNWGPSQISIVAPASVPNAAFTVTSVAGGSWLDNSQIYAPAAAAGSDFHGVGSLGAPTPMVANTEQLLFHFVLSPAVCTPGLRLFVNGTDPNSNAAGMQGSDFTNTVIAIVPTVPQGYEAYQSNYNNTGTSCCPTLTAPPPNVTIVNSTCNPSCIVGGGNIVPPAQACPAGSTLQYSVNNGGNWSTTVPVYAQTGPAQTIITRCSCDSDPSVTSPSAAPVTTVPGMCAPVTAFNVGGGGTRCTIEGGLVITLSGSQTGINYQLLYNGTPVGAPIAGTGNAINFPPQTAAGVYTVSGASATGSCTGPMNGSAVINVVTAPTNLVCNDLVTVSLDATCSLELNADQFLEGTYVCYDAYIVEIDRTLPLGNGPWQPGILGPGDVHHTYAVRVVLDANSNGVVDPGENSCWGNLAVEDKLPPVLQCPCAGNTNAPCTFTCADKDGILNGSIATPTPTATDNCSTPTLTKKDVFIEGGACNDDRIERTWTATDAWGNSSQCTQIFYLEPYDLADVNFPDDITIECAGCGVTAGTLPCVTGVPTVDGNDTDGVYEIIQYGNNCQVLSEGLCNMGAEYEDTRIDVCAGTFKILRHWTVLDWCTNTFLEFDQLIKVVDDQGPVITTPADMTVSTNPSQCCATVNLPDVIVEDACSATANVSAMVVVYDQYLTDQVIGTYTINGNSLSTFPGNNFWDCDTLAHYGTTPCLPIGHHQVMYMAEDVCGNTSLETFWLTVVDDIAPVATCTQFTTVAIGTDDPTDCYEPNPDCEFAGVTWVPASAFDQGSHDNCSPIAFTIRRMPEADGTYSDCIDGLSPLCDGYEYNVATTENDSIKFYCCEVGTTQTVILRVYQLDINGNRDYYRNDDGSPLTDPDGVIQYIYNECMINVEVQDKIKPTCQAPANVTINCENFEPTLWAYGYPESIDNCCLDQTPPTSADAQGEVGIPAGTTAIPGVCGMTQKTYYNNFLNANFDTTCNRGIIIRRFTAWDCQGQSSSCTQRITVTNTQDYNIVFPADVSVNCVTEPVFGKPVITNDEGCELIGVSYNDVVFTVVPDACYKVERTWTVINWCTYNPDLPCTSAPRNALNAAGLAPEKNYTVSSENCVTYKQIIKVIDQTPPTIACAEIDTCDISLNDARYWNDGLNWWDNGIMSHDLCEKETEIAVTADDFCDTIAPEGGLRFRYILFLDLDSDGIMETVVSSADANTRPVGQVRYGNYQNLNYGGGSLWYFDNNPNARYRFNIEQSADGARVTWTNNGSTIDPNLPHGTHKIKWIAEDGCGNEAVCEKTFTIRDCKPPVIACSDVNINLMIGGTATLWASDFFLYGDDNCTPDNILEPTLAVIRADENPGNTYPGGAPDNQSIVVTCDDFATGEKVAVQVWLVDAAGNYDFCIAYVDPQENLVGCEQGASASVAGTLATENIQGVEDASVELAMVSPTGQQGVLSHSSDDAGTFQFMNAVPMSGDYTLTPTKDDNPLNGVTTYDLVLINKHILGLEPLTTPYKMIAADANRSGSITSFDIVEFRKLILGIYNELPNNTSWRFVDKSHTFADNSNPFQTLFPENKSVADIQSDNMVDDFVGIKIGDVNNTVIANSLQSVDDRTAATMLFDVEDRTVKAGEVFTLNFKGAERVQGYQFTMNMNGLEVQDIIPGTDMKLDNFGVFADAITTSVDGEANEFAVTFRATKAGQISTMLGVSSQITKAEAYNLTNDRLDIAFRFNNGNTSTISGVGFELYQNQPNPFVNKTFIGFHLPEATQARLTVFDETGRIVFTQQGDFAKGYNVFAIDRQLITTTGVLYYSVETVQDKATRKMIQSK